MHLLDIPSGKIRVRSARLKSNSMLKLGCFTSKGNMINIRIGAYNENQSAPLWIQDFPEIAIQTLCGEVTIPVQSLIEFDDDHREKTLALILAHSLIQVEIYFSEKTPRCELGFSCLIEKPRGTLPIEGVWGYFRKLGQ